MPGVGGDGHPQVPSAPRKPESTAREFQHVMAREAYYFNELRKLSATSAPDPRRIAQRMLRNRWSEGGRGGFWRALPKNGTDAPT